MRRYGPSTFETTHGVIVLDWTSICTADTRKYLDHGDLHHDIINTVTDLDHDTITTVVDLDHVIMDIDTKTIVYTKNYDIVDKKTNPLETIYPIGSSSFFHRILVSIMLCRKNYMLLQ